jgi:acetolactate decarboxylase
MQTLQCRVSDSLWHALQARQRATGESIDHLVRAALADYLQVDHSTLFQLSSSTALVEGISRGEVTVGALREHGDFGLGTFGNLDGEMVIVDGRFYQVRSDGIAREVDDLARTPFAVVTRFVPERTVDGVACASLAELAAAVDRLRDSDNAFYAIRVDGAFARLHTRAMCRTADGVPLVEAAAHQPEFELRHVAATMIGFWSPDYAKTLSIPGYHLHVLTADRAAGGHVLDCAGTALRIQLQRELDLRISLPHSAAFLNADLTQDPTSDLDAAEH